MYAIYGNICHLYTRNVSIYTIHGSYGYAIKTPTFLWGERSTSCFFFPAGMLGLEDSEAEGGQGAEQVLLVFEKQLGYTVDGPLRNPNHQLMVFHIP